MYNKHSLKATEFIDDEEIKETLCFAQENKHNKELISSLIERAADCKGLTHREAAVLLECDLPEENEKMCLLRQPHRQVRTAVSVQLLHQRLPVLPIPPEKQTYRPQKADAGRNKAGGYCPAGYGTQATCSGNRRGSCSLTD